jgi:hypothetical protein
MCASIGKIVAGVSTIAQASQFARAADLPVQYKDCLHDLRGGEFPLRRV